MIQSKKLIPEIYSQSYDLSIFTGLIDLVYNSRDIDVARIKNAHSPQRAFTEDLVSLASLFNLPSTQNRDLIELYRSMIQLKGTSAVIEAAVQFVAALSATEGLVSFEKEEFYLADYPGHSYVHITVYSDFDSFRTTLLETLLDRLAPVNVFVTVRPRVEEGILLYELSADGTYYTVIGTGGRQVASITIPAYYNNVPVTEIAALAFSGNTVITSVKIGSNVTTIGVGAFTNCSNLKYVVFEDQQDWYIIDSAVSRTYKAEVSVAQDATGAINAKLLVSDYVSYTWVKEGYLYYTISFIPNLAIGLLLPETISYLATSWISSSSFPQLEDTSGRYEFMGWSLERGGTVYVGSMQITKDLTFYGKWQEIN